MLGGPSRRRVRPGRGWPVLDNRPPPIGIEPRELLFSGKGITVENFAPWISVLGLPIASGINLYATVLVLGLSQRFGWVEGLPQSFEILADPVVLTVAGVLYLLEFFADKIPFLDTLWDGLHTFIRPVGAAFLALAAAADYGPAGQFLAMLVGGALGLGAHSAKAGTRLLVNTSPEPISNSLVSVAEDFGVVGLLVLIYAHPWAALGVVLGLIVLMAAVMPMLFRVLRFLLGGIGGMMATWFDAPKAALTELPDWLTGRIPQDGAGRAQAFPCFARRVRGAASFQPGYLVVSSADLQFVFKTLLGGKTASLMEGPALDLRCKRRLLFDTLFVTARGKRSVVCIRKDWSAAVQKALHLPDAPNDFGAAETLAPRQT
jgi:Domain of unknown function (DUF4126)